MDDHTLGSFTVYSSSIHSIMCESQTFLKSRATVTCFLRLVASLVEKTSSLAA